MGERWSGRVETHLVAKEDDEPRMDAKRQRLEWEGGDCGWAQEWPFAEWEWKI